MILKKYYFLVAVLCLLLIACSSDSGGGGDDTVADTCATPTTLATAQITETSVIVSWSATGQGTFTVEYGPSGFTQGTGTSVTSSTTSLTISGLTAATDYQAYVRFNCANGASSSVLGPIGFTTLSTVASCPPVTDVGIFDLFQDSVSIIWSEENEVNSVSIEYGLQGFTPGQGTVEIFSSTIAGISNLTADTAYDYYLTSNCTGGSSEAQGPFTFTTLPVCIAPDSLQLHSVSSSTITVEWLDNGETAFQVEYGESGFTLGTGETIDLSDSLIEIGNLLPSTTYEIYVRANCGSDGFSQYSDALVATTDGFDAFIGNYLIEQVTPSIFGYDTFDPDGGGHVVTLHGPDTASSQTTENVVLSDIERAFDATYFASQGIGNAPETYVMNFSNGAVNFSGDETTGVQCASGIIVGPTTSPELYDQSSDFVFLFTFKEDITDDCGAGTNDVTLRFTRQ